MQQDMKKKYKRRKGERKLLLVVDENIVSKSKKRPVEIINKRVK